MVATPNKYRLNLIADTAFGVPCEKEFVEVSGFYWCHGKGYTRIFSLLEAFFNVGFC